MKDRGTLSGREELKMAVFAVVHIAALFRSPQDQMSLDVLWLEQT